MNIIKPFLYLATLLSIVPFLRPRRLSTKVLLWLPKLMAGALAPVLGLVGALGALLGLARRDWKLAGAGILGAGLAARFVRDIPTSEGQFDAAFGPDWQARVPASLRPDRLSRRGLSLSPPSGRVDWQRDLVYGQNPDTGRRLRADLWQPAPGAPRTGLGVINVHGGGWRVGDKDLGTRPFFQRLVGQGHVVLDIAYTLWPEASMPTMVSEVKQAILWLKEKASAYGLDPERIVVAGGSAGAHLALMAAYTPGHPEFPPLSGGGDETVRGVVAFYPPVDLLPWPQQAGVRQPDLSNPLDRAAHDLLGRLFMLHKEDLRSEGDENPMGFLDLLPAIVGGAPDEVPETYRLLSPINHVGPHCPPTLLLQGSDDVFALAPMVRRLDHDLQSAGVPSILVEFPHTEHAFDLVLPRISPLAQASTCDVERFLALLV